MEKELFSLYNNFLNFLEKSYAKESENWTGVNKKVKKAKLKKILNTEKLTFIQFAEVLREYYYSHYFLSPNKTFLDIWLSKVIIKFLLKKDLIKIKNNKIFFKKNFSNFFIKQMNEEEIRKKLEKMGIKLNYKLSFVENLSGKKKFQWKERYDQIPISLSSSIFLISKILENFPIKGKILFIGDDDFSSIFLSLVEPKFDITVVDIDKELLDVIEEIKKDYSIKNITTVNCDIRKSTIKEKNFIGFVTNPPYTLYGLKSFLKFGENSICSYGGKGIVIVGEEGMMNRLLLLQKFINKENFLIREIINGKISYPFIGIYKEDIFNREELKKLGLKISGNYLFASLCVIEKIPWKVSEKYNPKNIYNYL
ncbi:MAG: bis-aminopropyl spermidine synthase family protein [Candidatus Micrarchaeia archaeon]